MMSDITVGLLIFGFAFGLPFGALIISLIIFRNGKVPDNPENSLPPVTSHAPMPKCKKPRSEHYPPRNPLPENIERPAAPPAPPRPRYDSAYGYQPFALPVYIIPRPPGDE